MTPLRFLDQRERSFQVDPRPRDPVAQHKLKLILNHHYRNTQLAQYPRLALHDPSRKRLEDQKYLLVIRNLFPVEDATLHMIGW